MQHKCYALTGICGAGSGNDDPLKMLQLMRYAGLIIENLINCYGFKVEVLSSHGRFKEND